MQECSQKPRADSPYLRLYCQVSLPLLPCTEEVCDKLGRVIKELYLESVILGVFKFRQSCQTIIIALHHNP